MIHLRQSTRGFARCHPRIEGRADGSLLENPKIKKIAVDFPRLSGSFTAPLMDF
jgi:hypothetical protein